MATQELEVILRLGDQMSAPLKVPIDQLQKFNTGLQQAKTAGQQLNAQTATTVRSLTGVGTAAAQAQTGLAGINTEGLKNVRALAGMSRGLIGVESAFFSMAGVATGSMGKVGQSIGVASMALGGLRSVMMAGLGPWGLLAAGVAAAGAALVAFTGDSQDAEKANEKLTEGIKEHAAALATLRDRQLEISLMGTDRAELAVIEDRAAAARRRAEEANAKLQEVLARIRGPGTPSGEDISAAQALREELEVNEEIARSSQRALETLREVHKAKKEMADDEKEWPQEIDKLKVDLNEKERDRLKEQDAEIERFMDRQNELWNERSRQDQERRDRTVAAETEMHNQLVQAQEDANRIIQREQEDAAIAAENRRRQTVDGGFRLALENRKIAQDFEMVWTRAFNAVEFGVSDAFADMLLEGEKFKDGMKRLAKDLARIGIDTAVREGFRAFFSIGGGGGAGGGGFLSGLSSVFGGRAAAGAGAGSAGSAVGGAAAAPAAPAALPLLGAAAAVAGLAYGTSATLSGRKRSGTAGAITGFAALGPVGAYVGRRLGRRARHREESKDARARAAAAAANAAAEAEFQIAAQVALSTGPLAGGLLTAEEMERVGGLISGGITQEESDKLFAPPEGAVAAAAGGAGSPGSSTQVDVNNQIAVSVSASSDVDIDELGRRLGLKISETIASAQARTG